MGEGIIIYGVGGRKRRYTKDLQSFANHVLKTNYSRNSIYVFGDIGKTILRDLVKQGVEIKSNNNQIK